MLFWAILFDVGLIQSFFFTKYYQNPDKVGRAFIWGTVVITLFIIIAEASVHAVPFMKNYMDTKDPEFLVYKVVVLAIGITLYIAMTILSYQKSVKSFEVLDL